MTDPETTEQEAAELAAKIRAAAVPRVCRDLPTPDLIKPGFKLELRHPIPQGEGTPPVQQLTFRGLVFEDLDGVDVEARLKFGDYRQLIQRATRAAPTVVKALHLEDAQRAMYVVSAFLLPLRQ